MRNIRTFKGLYKLVFLLGSVIILNTPAMAEAAGRVHQAENPHCIVSGQVLLVPEFSVNFMGGDLLDIEKDANIVYGNAWYEDGTVLSSEMSHFGMAYGGWAEYALSPYFGIQLGLKYQNLEQKVSVGGGNYEEHELAKGNLLNFINPYLGISCFLVNEEEWYMDLTGRLGVITGGKLYPLVTDITYLGGKPVAFDLSGFNAGLGLGATYVEKPLLIGTSVFITQNFMETEKKIYRNLDQNFTLMSVDINVYVGVTF